MRDKYNGGTIFDKAGSLKGGRVDIRLLIPVDIKAVEVVGLDYHGTRQPKAMDIFVEGKLVEHADLPDAPGKSSASSWKPAGRTSASSSPTNTVRRSRRAASRWTRAAGCGCGC